MRSKGRGRLWSQGFPTAIELPLGKILAHIPSGRYVVGMEKRKRQPVVTRRRILEVAGEEFSKSGYAASGLGGIVETAGLTKGALFHHFADKRSLGLAWVNEVVADGIRGRWVEPMAELGSLDGLKAFCRVRLTEMTANDELAGLVLMAAEMGSVDAVMAAGLEEVFEIWRGGFAELLERGKLAGWIHRSIQPAVEAPFFVSMICGFSVGMRLPSADATRRMGLMALDGYLETLRAV